jgi:hypothetical protein
MKNNYTITGSNMICSSEDVPAREQVKEVDVPVRELKARVLAFESHQTGPESAGGFVEDSKDRLTDTFRTLKLY